MLFKKEENQRVHSEVLLDFDTFAMIFPTNMPFYLPWKAFMKAKTEKILYIFIHDFAFEDIFMLIWTEEASH